MLIYTQGYNGELHSIELDGTQVYKEDGGAFPLIVVRSHIDYQIPCVTLKVRDYCFSQIKSGNKIFPKTTRPALVTDEYAEQKLNNMSYDIGYLVKELEKIRKVNTKPMRIWGVFEKFHFEYFRTGDTSLLRGDESERIAMGIYAPKELCDTKITPEQFWHYLLFSPLVQERNKSYLQNNKGRLIPFL